MIAGQGERLEPELTHHPLTSDVDVLRFIDYTTTLMARECLLFDTDEAWTVR